MSSKQWVSALKIQAAWQKYREFHSCPVCLTIIGKDSCITKCGHKFCTGCLLKAVQRNGSCPLCRGLLIDNQQDTAEPIATPSRIGFSDQTSIRLTYYDQGYEDGRQHAEEEFQPRMREEIDIATQKAYDDGIVQGRSLASEDIRLLREEIKRLKQRNSRLREDLQFATQPTREIYR